MFDGCIYFNTTALARRLEREWATAFTPFGLTPPQAFMLRAILDTPGRTQGEVAAQLAVNKATATRALDGLQALGFIERRASEQDRREQHIHPTAKATAIRGPLNEASGQVTRRMKKILGEGTFDQVVNQVRTVRTALG